MAKEGWRVEGAASSKSILCGGTVDNACGNED